MDARGRPWNRRGPDRLGPGRRRMPARGGEERGGGAEEPPPGEAAPFGAPSSLARSLTMRAVGLPCPEPLAVVRTRGPGWTASGASPDDAAGWARVFERLPPAVSVRPAERTFGTRLGAFTRVGGVLVDQYGSGFTPLELAELLLSARDEAGWIVEARAADHPLLARLVDAGPMPAVVAVTLLGPGDLPLLLAADLAVEPPGGPRGRRRHGPARDLVAVDAASGRLAGSGPAGVLPGWAAVGALVARAARAAPDHRATGWDLLLTCRGPVIVDAWSPWSGPAGARARRLVEAALAARERGRDPLGEPLEP